MHVIDKVALSALQTELGLLEAETFEILDESVTDEHLLPGSTTTSTTSSCTSTSGTSTCW